jgi:hypothetical protein
MLLLLTASILPFLLSNIARRESETGRDRDGSLTQLATVLKGGKGAGAA